MNIGQFIQRVLHPRRETTRIPQRLDEVIQRQRAAADGATQAVDALLLHMETSRENRLGLAKK